MNASPDNLLSLASLYVRAPSRRDFFFFFTPGPTFIINALGPPEIEAKARTGRPVFASLKGEPSALAACTRARHSRVNEDYQAPRAPKVTPSIGPPLTTPSRPRHTNADGITRRKRRGLEISPRQRRRRRRERYYYYFISAYVPAECATSGPQQDRENRRVRAVSLVDPRGPMKSSIAREIVGNGRIYWLAPRCRIIRLFFIVLHHRNEVSIVNQRNDYCESGGLR